MIKEEIVSSKGAKVVGPYSPAIFVGGLVFVSGQIPVDPESGELVKGDIKKQTKQIFANIKALLEEAGADLDSIVKTTVYLQNMDDYVAMNDTYATFFSKPYPARATIQVAKLPKDSPIEIECIAYSTKHLMSAHEGGCCGGGGQCNCG